jgi:hypothetical protein
MTSTESQSDHNAPVKIVEDSCKVPERSTLLLSHEAQQPIRSEGVN